MLKRSRKSLGSKLLFPSMHDIIRFLLLSLCIIPVAAQGQITIKQYTSATDTFYWKRYEHVKKPPRANLSKFTVSKPARVIDHFLSLHLERFPQFSRDTLKPARISALKKCLYPVDLNGDQLPDMIFSGFSGGESDKTQIFLNRKDSFELVFEDYQYIVALVIQSGILTGLQMADIGCCDAYLYFTRNYTVKQSGSELNFIKGKQSAVYHFTERPFEMINPALPWQSVYDTTLIRASAANLDDPYNPYLETWGNTIAGFTQSIHGTLMAKKQDKGGKLWYYVEIIPDVRPKKSIFYEIDQFPTFIQGWVEGSLITLQP